MSIAFAAEPNPRIGRNPAWAARWRGVTLAADRPTYVVRPSAVASIRRHAAVSRLEVAGLLAGRVWEERESAQALVLVEAAIPADDEVDTSAVHVSFRPAAWDRLAPAIDALGPATVIVGWYHSHPGLGAFFSGTDRQTQAGAFRAPWQIGIVIDPLQDRAKAFRGPGSIPIPLAIDRGRGWRLRVRLRATWRRLRWAVRPSSA